MAWPQKANPAARRAILWLAALGFVLRLGVRLHSGAADFWVNGYTFFFDLARRILAGVLPDYRMPLYPLLLAVVTWGRQAFLPVVVVQSLIGAGTAWCAGLLAAEMFGSGAAVIAAGIAALYPYYVVHDTALQETSLFTLLTLVAVILLRRGSAWAGLALGAAVLTRATLAPFAALAVAWNLWTRTGKPFHRLALVCCVAPALLALAAFRGETGLELWNGNNPLTFSHYPRESSDLSKAAALDALTPAERDAATDAWFAHRAVAYMRDHPWLTVGNGFRKIGAAFGWLPSPRRGFWPDLVYALSYGPVILLGLYGMWMKRKDLRDDMVIYLGFVSFLLVTAVFFGHTSHRAHLDVYWIVFAAGALSRYLPASLAARIEP
jgi:hypothetical protein